jgi:4-hydroxybenzoate polyprenyltransferase
VGGVGKPVLLEIGKALLLLIIASLCLLTGFVAATRALPPAQLFETKEALTIVLIYLLPNFIFLAYRQMYSAPRYKNPDQSAAKWVLAWSGFTALLMIAITSVSPDVNWSELLYVLLLTSPLFLFCVVAYRLYESATAAGTDEDRRHKSFENLIFVPAFLLCIVNFSLGLLLKRRLDQPYDGLTELFSAEDIAYLLASFVVIALYYYWRVRPVIVYVACPLFVIAIGLFGFLAFNWPEAKFAALAIIITFFLGFAEITKHLYFLNRNDPNYSADERGIDLYLQGANWSGVVYPTLFLLLPAFFVEMTFFPILLIVYVFVLIWLVLTPDQKKSWIALAFSFGMGYSIPVAFILSIGGVTRFLTPPVTDQAPFQTLLALIALIGFMAGLLRLSKDLFGLHLDAFIMNIWNRQLYSKNVSCLYLLLAMSLVVCIVLTFAWFVLFVVASPPTDGLARAQYAARLALVGVAVVVLAVLAVIATIFWPTRLSIALAETQEINDMKPKDGKGAAIVAAFTAAVSTIHTGRLVLRSGRLGVSWIAGLAAGAVIFRSGLFSWSHALCAFAALTLVTMSGFIMNDVHDRQKDRIASKQRPIALGELSVATALTMTGCFIFVATTATLYMFGLSEALWIAVIAGALYAYSPVALRWPVAKGAYTSFLAVSPLLFAFHTAGVAVPILILALLVAYITFREAVLDAIDLDGDLLSGVQTVAYFVGRNRTLVAGWAGMFLTLTVSLFIIETPVSRLAISMGLIFQVVACAMFVLRLPYSLGVTRLTLCSGVLAVALSS